MPRVKGGAGAGASAVGKTPAAELIKQIKKFGLSQAQVAKDVGLSVMTLKKLLDGKAKVDIDRALIFAKYFGTSVEHWIELQKKAGLLEAKKNIKLQKLLKDLKKAKPVKIEKTVKVVAAKTGAKRGPKPGAKAGVKKVAAKKSGNKKTARKPRAASTPASSSSGFSF